MKPKSDLKYSTVMPNMYVGQTSLQKNIFASFTDATKMQQRIFCFFKEHLGLTLLKSTLKLEYNYIFSCTKWYLSVTGT